ncbi:hypothetical protein QJS04_geneDACA012687 [Acorus gramineus]|uniref:RING-type domain-containing protein n=1 Tax=Acorus gramineus TaxID=55184 RepID=A0AAV9B139_ACOGR|nr:hypothetical protein QJS04_geneDACA012687 [Acorus gramineus]
MEGRQNLTLSDRLSLASPSTTNPLKPRHGETLTLASILSIPTAADKIPGRTLLDIIRDESSAAATNRIHRAAPPPAPDEDGRVSLMALLEQTDRRSPPAPAEAEETETEEEGMYATCCVCMVRHKGAAFIPCGHTFCRLCSRELWVSRGNCPLCNGFILEILDIF